MMLEDIVRTYGMEADYYDNVGGKIYELTKAIDPMDGTGTLLIPVRDVFGDSILEGYAKMQKVS